MGLKVLAILVLLASLSEINSQSHDLTLGSIGVNDRLLAMIKHEKTSVPFTVRTSDVDYPAKGISQPTNISAIFVKDFFTNGKGGYASVSSGGVFQQYVRVHLKTQRGGAMNFTISIYGR